MGETEQVAVVTGAGRGIGAAIARRLAGAGVRVCVTDVDTDVAEATAQGIGDDGGTALATTLDVTQPDSCTAALQLAADELGPPTILVNNAGITRSAYVHRMTDEQWELVNEIVVRGTFNMIRAASPWFRDPERAERRIVNIASIAGVHGSPAAANYVAAKAGVIGLTKALAIEWATHNVTVNAVAPGLTETRMLGEAMPDDMRESLESRIPIGRLGQPEDIAAAVGFLCSPDAGYVTGQILEVHGGFTNVTVQGS